ncbi:hypothetical protein [Solimonas sp. K1W22B-7]|uniref:hypothetical protein n=1 Tax=Solimonas sp. K1W22B-7 TaxID=2303331 RepID=UPI0013C43BC8|nr:hypothetical protein [Solimonas sp. K1W22B-7]
MKLRIVLVAALLGLAGLAQAEPVRPAALDAYLKALAGVEAATAPVSLEPLMAAALAAQDALMEIEGLGDQAWLERLDEPAYGQLRAELRGFTLSRGFDVYAQPDAAFLDRLAQVHGGVMDREFFRLYRAYWSPELLPAYLSLGKRPTPCVRFGEGVVAKQYEGWRGFARKYPQAYAGFTRQTLTDLEEVVALGVCTCSDEASVSRELRGFVKRFPDSPVAGKVRSRLVELKENPTIRPVLCR